MAYFTPAFQGGVNVATTSVTGITDGTSNTVMFSSHSGGVMILFGDGSVRTVGSNVAITNSLKQIGIGMQGIQQILEACVISDPKDRRLLADMMLARLGFKAGKTDLGLLLPAAEALRAAARQFGAELKTVGAMQFFSAQPVADPDDRKVTAGLIMLMSQNQAA